MRVLKDKLINGGHLCVFQKNDFIVLHTIYGVYQGFYLLEGADGSLGIDRKKTPNAKENHFTTLEACLAHYKMTE